MPNAIIHFGAPVKGKKAVPVEVRNLGLSLLPSAPSQVVVDVANQYSQANFSVYKHALSLFVVAASEKKTVSLNESIYQQINHTHVPDFTRVPKIIWSYNYALSPDQKNEIKTKFEATETETQGKVAFTRVWKDQAWWNLLKTEGSINRHTATNSTNMNIAGFVHFMIILRIVDQFMRINQYSSYKDNTDDGTIKGQTLMTDTDTKAEEDVDVAGSSTVQVKSRAFDGTVTSPPKLRIYANTVNNFDNHRYTITDPSHLPADHTGIVFPYVRVLAAPDNQIFARVFSTYFMGFLGSSQEDALDMLETLKASWGNICRTEEGFELAHMLRVVEIALQCQSHLVFKKNHSNQYEGAVLLGGMFTLKVNGSVYVPESPDLLKDRLIASSSHESSLDFILSKLVYTAPESAATVKPLIRNIKDLSFVIRSKSYNTTFESEFIAKAYQLSFRGDGNYLSATSHNITTILNAMADPNISESTFPLHPEAITSQDRDFRLLSAFGISVPDFLVPAGKKMSLEGNFTVKEDGPQGKQTRDVHKLAVIMKDIKTAYQDLLTVKKERAVQNPFGNKLGSAASYNSSGLITRFEGDHARDVITALRKFTGAKEATQNPKRSRDADDEDDKRAKRSKLFDV